MSAATQVASPQSPSLVLSVLQSKAGNPQTWDAADNTDPDPYETAKKEIGARLTALKATLGDKAWKKGREKPNAFEAARQPACGHGPTHLR